MTRALITGITGQDGSYLAEFLLGKGYDVHGLMRRASTFNTARIDHIFDRLHLHHGDMLDGSRIARLIKEIQPHEVYHLASQSHVHVSFDQPVHTAETGAIGTINLLEALRGTSIHLYNASSSEMFGNAPAPQNEDTPFAPRSPYACAKVMAHHMVCNYREAYGMFACNGILFNHESPRRGRTFVTRKITHELARLRVTHGPLPWCACDRPHKGGPLNKLVLGNLNAVRDWGYAGDYVQTMWLMMQQDIPDDYVIATGVRHSVGEFLDNALGYLRLDRNCVRIDPNYMRPLEVDELCGDASKARRILGWAPTVDFNALTKMVGDADMTAAGLSPCDVIPHSGEEEIQHASPVS